MTEDSHAPCDVIAPAPSRVLSNRCVGPGWFVLRLREESIARRSQPGMFVQVACNEGESFDPLLRRPFSVYTVDRDAGTYDILYTCVGRGTRWMSQLPDPSSGDSSTEAIDVDVLGPLGVPFTLPDSRDVDDVFLIGGGVGVAPLYFLAQEILRQPSAPRITFCMGARNESLLAGVDDFRGLPIRTEVATDDGSAGFHGRVTEHLLELLGAVDSRRLRVYGCGPQGMNESLRSIAVERDLPTEICLESVMACGFGICFGCVAPIRRQPGGEFENRRICWEGPVFDARLLREGIDG